jgi:uncharacterized membrane protein YgdD (TMEM256/DUF423 family)
MDWRVLFFRISIVMGALGIMLGAFAAHGLRDRLTVDLLVIFETGVRYHMYHAIALFALSVASTGLWSKRSTVLAAGAWVVGVTVFSGSLYVLAISGQRWLGAITPIGGVLIIAGWCLLLASASSLSNKPAQ